MDLLLAEEGVVVEVQLGVDGEHLSVGMRGGGRGDHQRIDLHQGGIPRPEQGVDGHHRLDRLADLLADMLESAAVRFS